MTKYLLIYKRLFINNYYLQLRYRGDFLVGMIASAGWGIFSIIQIILLTSRSDQVFGWTREGIILLTASYAIIIGIFHTFLTKNMVYFPKLVYSGEMDLVLTKPINSQFLLSLRFINFSSLVRILMGVIFTVFLIYKMNIEVSWLDICIYLLLILCGLYLLYLIWFLVISLTIWFPRLSNLTEVMYTVSGTMKYPWRMFSQLGLLILLLLLPIVLMVNVPVRYLVGEATIIDAILLILVMVGITEVTKRFWRFALRFYTSASS